MKRVYNRLIVNYEVTRLNDEGSGSFEIPFLLLYLLGSFQIFF